MDEFVKLSTIEKLLEICALPEASILEKLAKHRFGDQFLELVDNNILTHFKFLKSIEVSDGDNEYFADIQRMDGKNMYFSPADGWVAVSDDEINLYKINFGWLLRQIMDVLDIANRYEPNEIMEEKIWALSQHRIEKQRINIVVVRDVKNNNVFEALINYLNNNHGARNPALVIVLDECVPDYLSLPHQNELIRIREAIKWDIEGFEINTVLLAGRMGGVPTKTGFSNGFRSLLSSNGEAYKFTKKQAEAIEYLYNHHGKPVHQDEVLAEIESSQSKLLQIFRSKGKTHNAWGRIIQSDGNGHYWLEY